MFDKSKWIGRMAGDSETSVVVFKRYFNIAKKAKHAELFLTATGVYVAEVNGVRVSYPLAPGADTYHSRIRFQAYDITSFIKEHNTIRVEVALGWYGFRPNTQCKQGQNKFILAELKIVFEDGDEMCIVSDGEWRVCSGQTISADLYDGEIFDATLSDSEESIPLFCECGLVPERSESEEICEYENIRPLSYFVTPKGERVIDFGQNMAGYVQFTVSGKAGDKIKFTHGEVLDKYGNFYNDNYRSAKAIVDYTCRDGIQTYHPKFSFFGFRYINLLEFPYDVDINDFVAVVVHSKMERTGHIRTDNALIDRLYENIIWSQKSNFIDIPTDCPQRDERHGWTGDTQFFCRTALYNYDCEKFFVRWLKNLRADQREKGLVPNTVPNLWDCGVTCPGWGDAATIVPWEVYMAYGDKKILKDSFGSMKAHIEYIGKTTKEKYLWTAENYFFGDWLDMEVPWGVNTGSSDKSLIASAFYYRSVCMLVLAGRELSKDVSEYEALAAAIREKFIKTYREPKTQTECVLMLYFDLTDDKENIARRLAEMIEKSGKHLKTGVVGTPYLLYALSENGYTELAYDLLLQDTFPSWLFSVKQGATTIWEHWDGKNENGDMWDPVMNSFNHYAMGAVGGWMYGVAAGITPELPGYEEARIEPHPDARFKFFEGTVRTRKGFVRSAWRYTNGKVRYEIETPVKTKFVINGKETILEKGSYIF